MIRAWDRPTRALFFLFTLWACSPVVVLAIRARSEGGMFGGAFAALAPADQYHYLAWIRDAGEHLLISDQFGPGSGQHVYLNPFFVLSGLAWRVGTSLQLAYLLWIPVAVTVLFGGFAAYVRRTIDRPGWPRVAALILALFYFTPVLPLVDWGDLVSAAAANHLVIVAGTGAPYWQMWGYLPTAVALGLAPLYMLGLERMLARGTGHSLRRYTIWTTAAGLAVSWLQPWAGLTLLIVTVALAVWDRFAHRNLALLAPAFAVAAPLLYYALLTRTDPAWGLAELQVNYDPDRPFWALVAALGPLVLIAIAGIRRSRLGSIHERLLMLWPVAAVVAYFVLDRTARLPALEGISLPLAVLAVRGWTRLRLPRALAVAVLGIAVLPGMVYSAQTFRDTVQAHGVPFTIRDEERAALRYLARGSGKGGVLAPAYIGTTVPAFAGRRSFVPSASADLRSDAAALIRNTGTRYLLSDCRHRANLARIVAPLGFIRRSFGCAAVYEHPGAGPVPGPNG